eukprot:PhM_4_TR13636/c0_g1_i1/m.13193
MSALLKELNAKSSPTGGNSAGGGIDEFADAMPDIALVYGSEISLFADEYNGFLASPGVAESHLVLARSPDAMAMLSTNAPTTPMAHFERCVFSLYPVESEKSVGDPITYGSSVKLVHKFSDLVVAVQRHQAASFDSACFRMCLQTHKEAGNNCNLRVLPRFKIRSEGEPVVVGDKVILQVEHSDLHVHASVQCNFGMNSMDWTTEDTSEINSSEKAQCFTIRRYDVGCVPVIQSNVPLSERRHTLALGRTLVMLHKERESVVTCNTSFHDHRLAKVVTTGANNNKTPNLRTRQSRSSTMRAAPPTLPMASNSFSQRVDGTKSPYLTTTERNTSTSLTFDVNTCSCNSLWIVEHHDPTKGGLI